VTFEALRQGGIAQVPDRPGTYVVLREKDEPPEYSSEALAGGFKGEDPTVPVSVLEAKWLPGCHVVYIGKAKNLRTRLGQYMKFGAGRNIGHRGGRYIWQLSDSADLLVAWRTCAEGEAHAGAEADLVREFKRAHGGLPFANISDPSDRASGILIGSWDEMAEALNEWARAGWELVTVVSTVANAERLHGLLEAPSLTARPRALPTRRSSLPLR
jgi:hypothetical protein